LDGVANLFVTLPGARWRALFDALTALPDSGKRG